jgi:hypothetical protein
VRLSKDRRLEHRGDQLLALTAGGVDVGASNRQRRPGAKHRCTRLKAFACRRRQQVDF